MIGTRMALWTVVSFAAVTVLAVSGLAWAGSCGVAGAPQAQQKKVGDVVDVAAGAGKFKTLLAAAKAAGLVEALKGEGPLTVFAPTDDAFAKLPAGTVENLLKPENKETLKAVLLYHVAAGKLTADKVSAASSIKTLNGASLTIKVADGKVHVDNAQVVTADVAASNGVIHIIDQVMLPPAPAAKE